MHCFHHTRFFLDLRFSEVRYAMDRPPCQRGISPMVNNGDASLTTGNQTCAEMCVARFKEFDNALSTRASFHWHGAKRELRLPWRTAFPPCQNERLAWVGDFPNRRLEAIVG